MEASTAATISRRACGSSWGPGSPMPGYSLSGSASAGRTRSAPTRGRKGGLRSCLGEKPLRKRPLRSRAPAAPSSIPELLDDLPPCHSRGRSAFLPDRSPSRMVGGLCPSADAYDRGPPRSLVRVGAGEIVAYDRGNCLVRQEEMARKSGKALLLALVAAILTTMAASAQEEPPRAPHSRGRIHGVVTAGDIAASPFSLQTGKGSAGGGHGKEGKNGEGGQGGEGERGGRRGKPILIIM